MWLNRYLYFGFSKYAQKFVGKEYIFHYIYIAVSVIYLVTSTLYVFTAQSISDYAKRFVFSSFSLLILSWYSNLFWQKDKYVKMFTDLKELIKKS